MTHALLRIAAAVLLVAPAAAAQADTSCPQGPVVETEIAPLGRFWAEPSRCFALPRPERWDDASARLVAAENAVARLSRAIELSVDLRVIETEIGANASFEAHQAALTDRLARRARFGPYLAQGETVLAVAVIMDGPPSLDLPVTLARWAAQVTGDGRHAIYTLVAAYCGRVFEFSLIYSRRDDDGLSETQERAEAVGLFARATILARPGHSARCGGQLLMQFETPR